MQRISPTPRQVHWGYFDAVLRPVAEVQPGERFRLRSVSGSPEDAVPTDMLPPEIPALYGTVTDRGPGPHLLTGPVFVRGARPGAALQVNIHAIELGADYGYNRVRPLMGMFPQEVERLEQHIVPIDRAAGVATILPGVQISARPFFGILGVAPPPAWGRISSSQPRRHGGNLDNKELTAGATLWLPVSVEGALFSAGDGHAAQGDGEVNVTAIETSLEGEFSLSVREDIELELPMACTPTHLITMGFDEDLDEAARIAVRGLLRFLQTFCGITWLEAYRVASIAADLRITQVVNGNKGVHAMLERGLLDQLGCRFTFSQ